MDAMRPDECPKCKVSWKEGNVGGIEVPFKYDGVSYWQCLKCEATFNRWTMEEVEECH